jgi:hypothetical protein
MDDLPTWVETIAAVAVGLMPALALSLARPIARSLHRVLRPPPEDERSQGRAAFEVAPIAATGVFRRLGP